MISTRGTPEITCREKDIRMLCPADRKDKNGFSIFTLWIYIADVEKPVATNYDSPYARNEDYARIRSAWQEYSGEIEELQREVKELRSASEIMKEAIEKTKQAVAEWGKKQAEEDRKQAEAAKKAKTTGKTKAKTASPFVPPTDEEIVKYILENGYEKIARQKPEGIAKRFRRFYMRDGKTWRLANGRPMKDWKKAMATWINNIDEDREMEAGGSANVKPNAFTGFENQNAYDESLEEDLLRIAAEDANEESNREQEKEKQKEEKTAGEGIPA